LLKIKYGRTRHEASRLTSEEVCTTIYPRVVVGGVARRHVSWNYFDPAQYLR